MGANVFNDISSYNEKITTPNGKKVVIIYTTAGNLYEDDDSKACSCKDTHDPGAPALPYWKVREFGANNSVHFAACKMGGKGPEILNSKIDNAFFNGHKIIRQEYKNTVSYFMRIKTGAFSQWRYNPRATCGTVDNSTSYADYNDFVNTLYFIYKSEMENSLTNHNLHFNCTDIDETINPNDHSDHLITGRGASEAAKILAKELDTCFSHSLYIDYDSQNLPANLNTTDLQNETAVTSVYCLALLDYNAWPEWGHVYQEWTGRNYCRTITTCQSPVKDNIMAIDSFDKLHIRVYPVPANNIMHVRFSIPVTEEVSNDILNISGANVYHFKGIAESNFPINTESFANGYYMLVINSAKGPLTKTIFEVAH